MSGKTTEESISMIKEARKKVPNTPIFLGGGAKGDNIHELMQYYDGVSVATWIKNWCIDRKSTRLNSSH